ncbi:MAG: hypothetical protein ABWY51_09080 [Gaiellaceae bacterium]
MTASRRLAFLPGLLAGLTLAVAVATPGAHAYHTNFQGSCHNESFPTSGVTRGQARIYAEIGANEGYQWGGGCWNDNNRDDAPGDPSEDAATRGEGGDCSGFTWKSWFERWGDRDNGFTYHYRMQNQHGPYTAAAFKGGSGLANSMLSKSVAIEMDALASVNHIGMIYQPNTAYNTDRMVEAKCEACGTGIWSRTYRGDPAYSGVRRYAWGH